MGHGYEIIALAGQPPEPTHAKYINADQKKTGCQVPFTNAARGPSSDAPLVSFRGLNKRFPEIRFVLGHETKVFTPGKALF